MIRTLAALLVCALLAGCSVPGRIASGAGNSASSVGTWAADLIAGGNEPENPTELEDFEPTYKPLKAWDKRLTDGIGRGFPTVRLALGETMLFVSDEARTMVTAIDLETKKRVWRQRLKDRISGGLGYGGGLVLAGTASGEVVAIEATSGEIAWTASVSSEVLAPPAAGSGVVAVSTGDGKLFGLNAATGSQKWLVQREVPILSLRGGSTPMVVDGVVLNGFADGHLMALDAGNGLTLWDTAIATPRGRTELDRVIDSDGDLTIRDGVVYAATFQGRVTAIGLHSGEILWARQLSTHQNLAADTFNVYVVAPDSTIRALDRRSGNTYWTQEGLQNRAVTAPVVFDGKIVVGDFDGYLHWLDSDTGEFVARSRLSRDRLLDPLDLGGELLVMDADGDAIGFAFSAAE